MMTQMAVIGGEVPSTGEHVASATYGACDWFSLETKCHNFSVAVMLVHGIMVCWPFQAKSCECHQVIHNE